MRMTMHIATILTMFIAAISPQRVNSSGWCRKLQKPYSDGKKYRIRLVAKNRTVKKASTYFVRLVPL